MQDARLEISALGIDALKALPPMIWCTKWRTRSQCCYLISIAIELRRNHDIREGNIGPKSLVTVLKYKEIIEMLTMWSRIETRVYQRIKPLDGKLGASKTQVVQTGGDLSIRDCHK